MANLDLEFDLDELINQVVFWQNRVKKFARKFYKYGKNKAEFDSAKQELNIWIVRLLTNHFELYAGSFKLVLKDTQPWAEDTDAMIYINQGVIKTQIPIRALRELNSDLYKKVRNNMSKAIQVFTGSLFGNRVFWGTAVLTEKVPGAIERWGITSMVFRGFPEKSIITLKGNSQHFVFQTNTNPILPACQAKAVRDQFDHEIVIELVPNEGSIMQVSLNPHFVTPSLIWGPTKYHRGPDITRVRPAFKPDGFFADGTPYWWAPWQSLTGGDYRGLVSLYDGIDVFAVIKTGHSFDSQYIDWWLATVVPNFEDWDSGHKPKEFKGWTEATLEQLKARREQVEVEFDAAYQEFVVQQHYFPWMHAEVQRLSEILLGLDKAIARLS